MAGLPTDVFLKILDLLETRDRARLALVSKEWHGIVTSSWTNVFLEPKGAWQTAAQISWLQRLARQNAEALRSLKIIPASPQRDPLLYSTGAVSISV